MADSIEAVTIEAAMRKALDSTGWESEPVLYWVIQEPGRATLQPTGLVAQAARQMAEQGDMPTALGPILDAIAWTGQMWGVSAVAHPQMVGMALALTGFEVRYDPEDTARADQVASYARDRKLRTHTDRLRVRHIHAAVRGQEMLSFHQVKGEDAGKIEMTGAVPDGVRACARAFITDWWEPV